MNYQDFVKPELLILIPVLYIIGIGLKKSNLSDRFIPLILGGISIALSAIWVLATCEISSIKDVASAIFVAITQGILAAGSSVYFNQLYVQSKKEK